MTFASFRWMQVHISHLMFACGWATRAAAGRATRWSSIPPISLARPDSGGLTKTCILLNDSTYVNADTVLYKFTVEDPTAFTKPWTAELPFSATAGSIFEYACHEGNYALMDILKGARAEEKTAEGKK